MNYLLEFYEFERGSDRRYYFFSTDNYDYRVSILERERNEPPSLGFKAKKKEESDFHYDQSIITNDNIYLVTNKILEIIEEDNKKFNEKSYLISTYSNKKGKQRMRYYHKMLKYNGWEITPTEYPTYFIIKKL